MRCRLTKTIKKQKKTSSKKGVRDDSDMKARAGARQSCWIELDQTCTMFRPRMHLTSCTNRRASRKGNKLSRHVSVCSPSHDLIGIALAAKQKK